MTTADDIIKLEAAAARERIGWVLEKSPSRTILTTSFGVQSAVLLHMVSEMSPELPVVFVDTGFLFEETYQFAQELTQRLGLNLKTYKPIMDAKTLVERHGELWASGTEGLEQYNQIVKVEPMGRALEDLAPKFWLSGLRRSQAKSRSDRTVLEEQSGVAKVYPLIDWSERDIYKYLKTHDLPYHPLWEKGFVSVGDYHSSAPLQAGQEHEKTRFSGVKRECGLHEAGETK
ncbi:MAG: phosphoadenylyl-sulfate reductase [Verrucomicrobiota bacterium]